MMDLKGYLAVLADSDLFGVLAIVCFFVAIGGLFAGIRNSKGHRALVFLCLMSVPLLEAVGSYFANLPPA
ncbi:Permease [Pseudomonas chlororaphis]